MPAGTYQVTVSVGDQPPYDSATRPGRGRDSGQRFVSTAATEYRQATVTVPVSDGRLTVDAIGGRNTKLDYVQISRVTSGTPPSGLKATPGDSQVALTWTGNATSYQVFRNGGLLATTTTPAYLDTAVTNGTSYSYSVTSDGGSSAAVTATPPGSLSRSISRTPPPRHRPATSGTPARRTRTRAGTAGSTSARQHRSSLVGNGRNRNPAAGQPDVRLATFMHAQLPAGLGRRAHAGRLGGRGAHRHVHGDGGGRRRRDSSRQRALAEHRGSERDSRVRAGRGASSSRPRPARCG